MKKQAALAANFLRKLNNQNHSDDDEAENPAAEELIQNGCVGKNTAFFQGQINAMEAASEQKLPAKKIRKMLKPKDVATFEAQPDQGSARCHTNEQNDDDSLLLLADEIRAGKALDADEMKAEKEDDIVLSESRSTQLIKGAKVAPQATDELFGPPFRSIEDDMQDETQFRTHTDQASCESAKGNQQQNSG